jgi:ligand-binding SRPBCC domain-containing protein
MSNPIASPDVVIERLTATSWVLRATQTLPHSRDSVFPFFGDATNLERITPAEMGFEILTPSPIEMRAGRLIDYHIRLHGLRLRWRTLISEWKPPFEFVDIQVRGPYAEWVHHHRFTPTADGNTRVDDEVRFRLPLGLVGTIAAPLVKRQLRRIFTYRFEAIARVFAASPESAGPARRLTVG